MSEYTNSVKYEIINKYVLSTHVKRIYNVLNLPLHIYMQIPNSRLPFVQRIEFVNINIQNI